MRRSLGKPWSSDLSPAPPWLLERCQRDPGLLCRWSPTGVSAEELERRWETSYLPSVPLHLQVGGVTVRWLAPSPAHTPHSPNQSDHTTHMPAGSVWTAVRQDPARLPPVLPPSRCSGAPLSAPERFEFLTKKRHKDSFLEAWGEEKGRLEVRDSLPLGDLAHDCRK